MRNIVSVGRQKKFQRRLLVPEGDPDNGLTSYQIALKFLTAKANEYAVAPILLPSEPSSISGAGWSTALIPPAA